MAVAAQCASTINAFPYSEGFENSAAWTSGGTGNDWAWGSPTKPVINGAGGGSKAWCVGGLTGSFYAFGEQSWLQSPCFDFTALPYPYISFKIFWECERTYDGLGFQYSTDGGITWGNVGTANEPDDCYTQNWFNTTSITNLNLASPKAGWSGRIGPTQGSCAGGQGSGGWVTASHCLSFLAGEPEVRFRFIFGAGTTCNNYDGVAVDDVYIGPTPLGSISVTHTCFADSMAVTGVLSCAESLLWDFDDPASGASNTSTSETPVHVFSAPGVYNVTLTLEFACHAPHVMTLPKHVLDLEVLTTDPSCDDDDGTLEAVVSNAQGPLSYTWTPGGYNTALVTGLSAGTYVLSVNDGAPCPSGATVTLNPPSSAPAASSNSTSVTCNGLSDGSATITVTGGTPGYGYSWSPAGGSSETASNLGAGTYVCTVTDANGCSATIDVVITEPAAIMLDTQDDAALCLGDGITLQATASGGTPGYTYVWSPDGPDVSPTATTVFTVIATDANGCTSPGAQVQVSIGSVATPSFTVADTMGCSPHCATFLADNASGTLSWEFGDGTPAGSGSEITHCFTNGGVYDVTLSVTSDEGCSGTWTLPEAVDVIQSPTAAFITSPPVTTIKEPLIRFINQSSNADSVIWNFGDGIDTTAWSFDSEYTYAAVGCYAVHLIALNDEGCSSTADYLLCVEDEFAAYVPNAFTPNDDGFNDDWGIVTTVGFPRDFELTVFDRWGRELFVAADKTDRWDGAGLPNGVYPWRLRLRDTAGTIQERVGHVTLVR